eukprot:CAMPEP_0172431690 /NCGR_PEP_ID=MMETSP1064-20121228/59605_1 /TAXON_ID=202472 /ORGANISM="Aulacoseira subarctica , Strain CCAP 1002/5" /LENGTH=447 /DNA_ID=CAMNT_0013178549 /DNA_START=61 /DNA_END=1407 /DNA_ORIENTATION=-
MPTRGDLSTILSRKSYFPNENGALPIGEFQPCESEGNSTSTFALNKLLLAYPSLNKAQVLVVGAGGLGCEILKDLSMSGIANVHVIDMDTIDVTNLNRQFLFRKKDVGKSKSDVGACFINTRCPWMKVTPHFGDIKQKNASWYAQFQCIISGLDSVEARRWLNAMVCSLVQFDQDGDPDPTSIIPIIDGGSEAFKGQARVILPRITSCFECSLDAFPPQKMFPMCTIAETPRLPEHCISYAFMLEWPKVFPDKKLDKDSPEDMEWVYKVALERANKYNISGVTYMLTMGVVKNIIPAVASTNAIIAAACVNEAVKILSFCSESLNNYMMYMGTTGLYNHTFVYERKEDCPVCTSSVQKITLPKSFSLNQLIQMLIDGGAINLRLKQPSITTNKKTLYMQKPPSLEKATRPNLDKAVSLLIDDGEELTITDPVFPGGTSLGLLVSFEQ